MADVKPAINLRELAKRGALLQLAEILEEEQFIKDEFPELFTDAEGGRPVLRGHNDVAPKKRGRPKLRALGPDVNRNKVGRPRAPMTEEQRKAISRRMKRYHARKRRSEATQ